MAWTMKLHQCTPLLAMRDGAADNIRKWKAGKNSGKASAGRACHCRSPWTFKQ